MPAIEPGTRFTRLVATEIVGLRQLLNRRTLFYIECRCDCGRIVVALDHQLRYGNTRSCGCLRKEQLIARSTKHGHCGKPEFSVWRDMHERCYNAANHAFHHYGGRGIIVDERWHTFENFLADLGPRSPKMTLERIDNDKPYGPDNCKWATQQEQCNNMRRNVRITYQGRTQTVAQWSRELSISPQAISDRIKRGYSTDEVLAVRIYKKGWRKKEAVGGNDV